MIMDNLRRYTKGSQPNWTRDQILAGLNHFYQAYGRYPTALEIDRYEYLPSSRSIQRAFGGLVALRKEILPDGISDFTRGEYRSSIAKKTIDRAVIYEQEFYDYLVLHFQEVAVHEHKVIRPGNVNSDFYIYLDESHGVVIDLFYAQDVFSLIGVLNIKLRRYRLLPETMRIFFVLVGNNELSFNQVAEVVARRKITFPQNILVDTEDHFKSSTILELKQQSIFTKM